MDIIRQAATQWTELVASLENCEDDEEVLIKVADREYVINPMPNQRKDGDYEADDYNSTVK